MRIRPWFQKKYRSDQLLKHELSSFVRNTEIESRIYLYRTMQNVFVLNRRSNVNAEKSLYGLVYCRFISAASLAFEEEFDKHPEILRVRNAIKNRISFIEASCKDEVNITYSLSVPEVMERCCYHKILR